MDLFVLQSGEFEFIYTFVRKYRLTGCVCLRMIQRCSFVIRYFLAQEYLFCNFGKEEMNENKEK